MRPDEAASSVLREALGLLADAGMGHEDQPSEHPTLDSEAVLHAAISQELQHATQHLIIRKAEVEKSCALEGLRDMAISAVLLYATTELAREASDPHPVN